MMFENTIRFDKDFVISNDFYFSDEYSNVFSIRSHKFITLLMDPIMGFLRCKSICSNNNKIES